MEGKEESVEAVVESFHDGHHGPYFSADSEIGKITVSLSAPIWKEERWPEGGMTVIISDLCKKRKGWRGYSARFFRPGDAELPEQGRSQSMEE